MVPTPVTPPSQTEIVRQLTLELDHTDPNVRRKAIWELGQQGNSDAILPLIDLMATSDSHQRCLILAAVSEIGIRILKPMNRALIVSMQDENADVRKNAIREITRIYDLVAQVNRHLRFAVNDVDAEVRKTAQWALQRIDRTLSESDSTLPELSTLVQSSEHGVETPSDNGKLSSVNRSSGDRPSPQ
jgi:HEAT repeat protein